MQFEFFVLVHFKFKKHDWASRSFLQFLMLTDRKQRMGRNWGKNAVFLISVYAENKVSRFFKLIFSVSNGADFHKMQFLESVYNTIEFCLY